MSYNLSVHCYSPFHYMFLHFRIYVLSRFSRVSLFATLWTVAHLSPLSVGFSRQEYWNGFPFPSPRKLGDPGIEPASPALQADALPSEPPRKLIRPFA